MVRCSQAWGAWRVRSLVAAMRFSSPARVALPWEKDAARSSLLCVLLPLDAWLKALLRRCRNTSWGWLGNVRSGLRDMPSRIRSFLHWASRRETPLQRVHEVDDVLRGPRRRQVSRRLLRVLLAQLFDQDGAIAILKIGRIEVLGLCLQDMLGAAQHLIGQR